MKKYDLIVIGSGPAGEKAAVKAAYFKQKVAIIEKGDLFGGSATYFTLPSKALKEVASKSQEEGKNLYKWFPNKKKKIMQHNSMLVYENLVNHRIDIHKGTASFIDANHIEVANESGKYLISGENIIIAGGVKTLPPDDIPIDGKRLHIVETIMNIKKTPSSICILGAGVIGCEFATIFRHLGSKVILIDENTNILTRFDREIVKYLLNHMKGDGIDLYLGHKIKSITAPKKKDDQISICLKNGKKINVEMFFTTAKRSSQIADLKFSNAGIKILSNQLIPVNKYYQTNISNIYAVGDVIGKPSLANVSMDQGRFAVSHILKLKDMNKFSLLNMPHGIYTIPEISTVGLSEEAAIESGYEIVIGKAYYSDISRGIVMGVKHGMIKLVIDKKQQRVLGVHIIGLSASELIHFGVELVVEKKNLNDIINANFNFPSLHELYKYAAFDGLSIIMGRMMKVHQINEIYNY